MKEESPITVKAHYPRALFFFTVAAAAASVR